MSLCQSFLKKRHSNFFYFDHGMYVHVHVHTYTYMYLYVHICMVHGTYALYMYITKYSCVFLKLGESIYVAMDLIPILLGSLPIAHNAQHSASITLVIEHALFYMACVGQAAARARVPAILRKAAVRYIRDATRRYCARSRIHVKFPGFARVNVRRSREMMEWRGAASVINRVKRRDYARSIPRAYN